MIEEGDKHKSINKEQQILEILRENLELNREMTKSLKFIKTYFHRRTIFNLAKIIILVGVVVFGAMSFKTAVGYFEGYNRQAKTYSSQLKRLSNFTQWLEFKKQ